MQQTNQNYKNEIIKNKDNIFLNQSLLSSHNNDKQFNFSNNDQTLQNSSRNYQTQNPMIIKQESRSQYDKNQLNMTQSKSSNTNFYLYQFWKGQHTFFLNGMLWIGPRMYLTWNLVFWFLILFVGSMHLIFVIPYVMNNFSHELGVLFIILFTLLIIFTLFTQFSDPGNIPRRRLIQTIPQIQERIENLDEMINENAYKTMYDIDNNQNCQKLGQIDQNQHKQSIISNNQNNSKHNSSFLNGNSFMNARTNAHSDLFLFKKSGSIQSNVCKNIKSGEKLGQDQGYNQQYNSSQIKKVDLSIMNNTNKSPNSFRVNQNDSQVQIEAQEKQEQGNDKNNSQCQNCSPQKNSSYQNNGGLDQTLSRVKNNFIQSQEERDQQIRKNRDEWKEDSLNSTTEIYKQENGENYNQEIYEEAGDGKYYQNQSYQNDLKDIGNNKREKFHMHINIENEQSDQNKQENEEIQKRRTIFSYLDSKISNQRIQQNSNPLNFPKKEDVQQGEVLIDCQSENKTINNNRNESTNLKIQQQQKYQNDGIHNILRDQFESTQNIKSNFQQKANSNNILKIQQSNNQISDKSIPHSSNNNYLVAQNGYLLQESMVIPNVNVDSISQRNQYNDKNEKIIINNSNQFNSSKKQNIQYDQEQIQIYQIEDNNEQKGKVNYVFDINSIKSDIQANNQNSLNQNQIQKEQNHSQIQNDSNPFYFNKENKPIQVDKIFDEAKRNFKENQNQQLSNLKQIISDQSQQICNQKQVIKLFQKNDVDTIKQNIQQQPIENELQYKKNQHEFQEDTYLQKQEQREQQQFQKLKNDENLQQNGDRGYRLSNIFILKGQKCNQINTQEIMSYNEDNQFPSCSQKQIDDNNDFEEKMQQTQEITSNNQINNNIFIRSKPQITSNEVSQRGEIPKQTDGATKKGQNEDDQNDHKKFKIISISNYVTSNNNEAITISDNTSRISNFQAIKLNQKFNYEMSQHEQNIKRQSESVMQKQFNSSMIRFEGTNYQDKVDNKNIFDIPSQVQIKDHPIQYYDGRKYCTTCQIFRPPRSSHCTYCDCCVEVFDHHCIFVNNCIGKRNYKYFFTFLTLLKLAIIIQFVSQLCYIIKKKGSGSYSNVELAIGVIYLFLIFLTWLYVLYLWGFHVLIQYKQLTTREQLKELDYEKDPTNYFNWCSHSTPIFNPRILVTDAQRYILQEDI